MRLELEDKYKNKNIIFLLRQAGYHQEVKRRSGEVSYVRSLGGSDFPRFHVYINENPDGWELNLHLDQKAPSYSGAAAHGGEYQGSVVEQEINRLKAIVK